MRTWLHLRRLRHEVAQLYDDRAAFLFHRRTESVTDTQTESRRPPAFAFGCALGLVRVRQCVDDGDCEDNDDSCHCVGVLAIANDKPCSREAKSHELRPGFAASVAARQIHRKPTTKKIEKQEVRGLSARCAASMIESSAEELIAVCDGGDSAYKLKGNVFRRNDRNDLLPRSVLLPRQLNISGMKRAVMNDDRFLICALQLARWDYLIDGNHFANGIVNELCLIDQTQRPTRPRDPFKQATAPWHLGVCGAWMQNRITRKDRTTACSATCKDAMNRRDYGSKEPVLTSFQSGVKN
ncbi:unnamed protein product [Soboliphyme baturini]|uniref:Uncharacterized protein n=1 Tax=Soboliphyme baturini TaxID=241478 RepID=A0A183IDC1_9BILA|nr:unnamed protein product [Soboliphyme baturini]